MAAEAVADGVLRVADLSPGALPSLIGRYGLRLVLVADDAPIPGSYWGEPEAGLIGMRVFARGDTPLHSVLHEAAHTVCMSAERRAALDRDAGGDDVEEAAVCYLQIVHADFVPGAGRDRLMRDMDAWGYSFRLGSARRWFEADAEDAREFLERHGLLTADGRPTWDLRR